MPVRVGTFTDFRPHNRRIAVALTLSTLMTVILIYLYVTGFCFSTLRYHGDAEVVDIAINTNLALHKPGTERDKVYSSLVEFHELNPKCCKVYRTGHWMLSGPGRAATGDVVVNVL